MITRSSGKETGGWEPERTIYSAALDGANSATYDVTTLYKNQSLKLCGTVSSDAHRRCLYSLNTLCGDLVIIITCHMNFTNECL